MSPTNKNATVPAAVEGLFVLALACGCSQLTEPGATTATFTGDLYCSSLAFSPDGSALAAGGSPHFNLCYRSVLRDANDGTMVASFEGLGSAGATFSPDGKLLVTADWFGEIVLRDAMTGEKLHTVAGHHGAIQSLAFSPDGTTIATGGQDKLVRLWSTGSLTPLATLEAHTEPVTALAFSPSSKLLATGATDKTVRLWSTETKQELQAPLKCEWSVRLLRFSQSGDDLIAAGSECTTGGLSLWDVRSGRRRMNLDDHQDGLFESHGPSLITVTSTNASVVWWDSGSGEEMARIVGNDEKHYTLSFEPKIDLSPDGGTLAIGVKDIAFVDSKSGKVKRRVALGNQWIDALAYSSSGSALLVGVDHNRTLVLDTKSDEELFVVDSAGPRTITCSAEGSRFITTEFSQSNFGVVGLFDPLTKKRTAEIQAHRRPVSAIAFSPDGTTLASGSQDGTVRLWDWKTRSPKGVLADHRGTVYQIAFAPGGNQLVTASDKLRVWNPKTSHVDHELGGFMGALYAAAYSPDGNVLVGGDSEGNAILFNPNNWSKLTEAHCDWPIRAAAFSPDGKLMALAGGQLDRGAVDIRQATDGSLVRQLGGHSGPVTCVQFASNTALITGSIDKTWRKWAVETGTAVVTSPPLEAGVTSIAISADGRQAVIGSSGGISFAPLK